ncbi:MAG: ABC transporter ATP-binding protein [Jatrophihabitantaceae bacterium]
MSAPDADVALCCAGLQVSYSGVVAVDDLDLTVAPGDVLAVLGPSGCGKSTLLNAVAGLVPPSAGEIWLAGRCVATHHRSTPPERRDVGLVFQDFALWPHLSALDTVAYPLRRAGSGRRDARAGALRLLDRLGVGHLADRRPAQLSGGQQQRVGLARALARSPKLFLLDEPTAHLDTHLRAAFQASVREQQAATGAAAVYATHDAAEALALADRVALVIDGRMVQLGSPEVVYAEPASAATAVLTGACTMLRARVAAVREGGLSVDLGDGPVIVSGGGVSGADPVSVQLLLRPEWLCPGGPLAGRVTAREFRGAHTDYRLDTPCGSVLLQMSGSPRFAVGESLAWGIRRAWALPREAAAARTPSLSRER